MSFQVRKCCTADNIIIEGLLEFIPQIHEDSRGFFQEIFCENNYESYIGHKNFVQDNISKSAKGVLRGLHFQKKHTQAKLLSVIEGSVYDIAVDLRNGSKTFGKYYAIILDDKKKNQLYIPAGFAHGFFVLSEYAVSLYKCSDYYDPATEDGLMWNDSLLSIDWKTIIGNEKPILSEKDKKYCAFNPESLYFDMNGVWLGK